MLKKNDLIDYFYEGIKNKNDLRIGVEHEKFVLKKDSLHQLSYEESNGIKDIIIANMMPFIPPIRVSLVIIFNALLVVSSFTAIARTATVKV